MRLDFVSDIVCPWCAIGLHGLLKALDELGDSIGPVDLHIQPFELNPQMGPEGEGIFEHIQRKYGLADEAQWRERQALIAERGRAAGFTFGPRQRIHNTFDAHRLLHLASVEGAPGTALKLKLALLQAYHGETLDPSRHDLLQRLGVEAGLPADRVQAVLGSDEFAAEVRRAESHWQGQGISGVPALIIDNRWLVSGGQPVDAYVQALRQAAQGSGRGAG